MREHISLCLLRCLLKKNLEASKHDLVELCRQTTSGSNVVREPSYPTYALAWSMVFDGVSGIITTLVPLSQAYLIWWETRRRPSRLPHHRGPFGYPCIILWCLGTGAPRAIVQTFVLTLMYIFQSPILYILTLILRVSARL